MKKLFILFLCLGTFITANRAWADTAQEGQSTEGKDFWITFMQADQDANNALTQSLSFSSRETCQVTVEQPFTGWDTTLTINANELVQLQLYSGNVITTTARAAQAQSGIVCYAVNSQVVDTCALHITATSKISVFATSYKKATFDATNVIPTTSLKDSYMMQMYSPSDHGMDNTSQGSHFAIIAAEDSVIVDYVPTVKTYAVRNAEERKAGGYILTHEDSIWLEWQLGDTLTTPMLMKGEVYYVWTGKEDWKAGDLSGTSVVARNGKKIAVFQGCPHTNIPYDVKERDHIFSQAMPTQYWGNTFVLTTSNGRKRDVFRILALNDETEVYINGNLVHTFDFVNGSDDDKKHFYEFDLGDTSISPSRSKGKVDVYEGPSCLVETSCPCAVHEFMASKKYDGVADGDPAMLWVNPVEQQIDQVTFATYSSLNGTTAHNVNIVTTRPDSMYLDGVLMPSTDFKPIAVTKPGQEAYYFAQKSLGSVAATHTLKNTDGSFIAHVYGFTSNESYGYSAGGATKPLTQYITINGKIFTPESDNTLCGDDTVKFACHPDYVYEMILWDFGDGAPIDSISGDSVAHYYPIPGVYYASCTIRRSSSNICKGQSLETKIPIRVTIGNFKVEVDSVHVTPCRQEGKEMIVEIFLENPAQVDLSENNDSVKLGWNKAATDDGFTRQDIRVISKTKIEAVIPETAQPGKEYAITLHIGSECPSGVTDTELPFTINYEEVTTQRFQNVIGLKKSSFENYEMSDFQWYKDSVLMPNEKNSVLNLYDHPDFEGEYYICFTMVNKTTGVKSSSCSCPVKFNPNESKDMQFDTTYIELQQAFQRAGEQIYVNTKGTSTVEWYTIKGDLYRTLSLPDKGGLITVPSEPGMYVLRVTTDKQKRTFKFVVFSK